ncbi:MAG: hypothetical protein IT423_09020 [Pirellulaceae bacterium]|nr:hypothetical protein [Pirellulaceae bacterium]
MRAKFAIGDRVIYTRDKYSNRPGPRAKNVAPTPHGETYAYQVDKYWTVTELTPDGSVVLITRRGKTHVVPVSDPRLRKANWWERLFYSGRFPDAVGQTAKPVAEQVSNAKPGW